MTACYEIYLLVLKKYFIRSLRSLLKYFSTIEGKIHISHGQEQGFHQVLK